MGHVYDRRRQQQLLHHKTIFLPMFCRLSLKDINLCRHRRRDSALSDEPSSPKVTCMGQVKRNSRVSATATPPPTHHHNYSKLKKLFSSKALLPPAAAPSSGRSGSKSCRSSKELVCVNNLRRLKLKDDCERVVDVTELDPPLPVLRKAAPPGGCGGDEASLWKRRFNGAVALKTLQIQNVDSMLISKISLPPTV